MKQQYIDSLIVVALVIASVGASTSLLVWVL